MISINHLAKGVSELFAANALLFGQPSFLLSSMRRSLQSYGLNWICCAGRALFAGVIAHTPSRDRQWKTSS